MKKKSAPVVSEDQKIVDRCNELAREFYASQGYAVDEGYRFDRATHPHERGIWNMAMLAFEFIEGTDVEDALIQAEEKSEQGTK